MWDMDLLCVGPLSPLRILRLTQPMGQWRAVDVGRFLFPSEVSTYEEAVVALHPDRVANDSAQPGKLAGRPNDTARHYRSHQTERLESGGTPGPGEGRCRIVSASL